MKLFPSKKNPNVRRWQREQPKSAPVEIPQVEETYGIEMLKQNRWDKMDTYSMRILDEGQAQMFADILEEKFHNGEMPHTFVIQDFIRLRSEHPAAAHLQKLLDDSDK
jgi:hypothetical protein